MLSSNNLRVMLTINLTQKMQFALDKNFMFSNKVIKQSLNPFWDQTLVFTPIVLHGTRENIKLAPPKVVLEGFDKDLCVSTSHQ